MAVIIFDGDHCRGFTFTWGQDTPGVFDQVQTQNVGWTGSRNQNVSASQKLPVSLNVREETTCFPQCEKCCFFVCWIERPLGFNQLRNGFYYFSPLYSFRGSPLQVFQLCSQVVQPNRSASKNSAPRKNQSRNPTPCIFQLLKGYSGIWTFIIPYGVEEKLPTMATRYTNILFVHESFPSSVVQAHQGLGCLAPSVAAGGGSLLCRAAPRAWPGQAPTG